MKKNQKNLRYVTLCLALLCTLIILAQTKIHQPKIQKIHGDNPEILSHNASFLDQDSDLQHHPNHSYEKVAHSVEEEENTNNNTNDNPSRLRVKRERIISTKELPLGKEPFELRLFDGKIAKVTPHTMKAIQNNDADYYRASIEVDGKFNGELSIVRNRKNNKAISGRLVLETGELFSITPTKDGHIKLQEIDPNEMPGCSVLNKQLTMSMDLAGDTQQNVKERNVKESISYDSQNEVDLLVLYTPNAKNAKGGQSAIETEIMLAIQKGKEAIARHGSNLSLRLVHMQEISYTESGSNSEDLGRLANMSEVHNLRKQYGADIVSLINKAEVTDSCGVAYLISNLQSSQAKYVAYNVVSYDCAATRLTLVHEIGHNLGLAHDHEHSKNIPSHSFAYGHRFGEDQYGNYLYRSVMAYGVGTRLALFSSPNHTYKGWATGIPEGEPGEADNTRALTLNAPYAAKFFDTKVVEDHIKITGTVLIDGNPLSGVSVDGGSLGFTSTNSSGYFEFTDVVTNSNFTLKLSKENYIIEPSQVSGTADSDKNFDFTARLGGGSKYNITGKVKENGQGIANVTVDGGSLGTVTTNSNGEFSFQNIGEGTAYSISFKSTQYTFSPASISGTLRKNVSYEISATAKGGSPSPNDSDGDGVSNEQEIKDGTNPNDSGSVLYVLPTTMCSDWNGFLGGEHYEGMYNILEYVSQSSTPLKVNAVLYKMDGRAEGTNESPTIDPGGQFDLLVHDMKGRNKSEIGLVCYSHSGNPGDLDGNMVYYKMDSHNKGEIEFAFAMPMATTLTGNMAVPFNTFHPSYEEEDQEKIVANWIQLSNRSKTTQSGYMVFMEEGGKSLEITKKTLKPSQRIDISGHKFGKQKVGIAFWNPDDTSAPFQLRAIRYLYDNVHLTPDFYTAFHIPGSKGIGEMIVVPLDSSKMGSAIIELSNVTSNNSKVNVEIYDNQKPVTDFTNLSLDLVQFQTKHIITDHYLSTSKQGIAIIKPSSSESTIATVIQYDRDEATGKIKSIYEIKAREPLGENISSSWNTWEDQSCQLLISNPTSQTQRVKMSMKYDNGNVVPGINDITREIKPKSMHTEVVCDYVDKNKYGKIELKLEQKNSIVASMIRIGRNASYKFSTPMR